MKLRDIGVLVEKEDIEEGNIGISTKFEKDKIICESIFMTLDIDNMSYYKKLEEYIENNNIHTSGNYYEI